MDISPVVAAIVASLLTAALSVVVQLVANSHARKMAVADREAALEADRERRRFEARERRYEDRRDAVADFGRAVADEIQQINRHMEQHDGLLPGDVFMYMDSPSLSAAYSRVTLMTTPDVTKAASDLLGSVDDVFHGRDKTNKYRQHLNAYREACRATLAEEAPPTAQPDPG